MLPPPTRSRSGAVGTAGPSAHPAAVEAARRDAAVISHGDGFRGDVLVVHAVNSASLAEKRRAGQWLWLFNPLHLWVAIRDRWMIAGLRYRVFVAVSDRVSKELQHYFHVPASR